MTLLLKLLAQSINYISIFISFCRGKQFRTDFDRISEIRSLLPTNTNVMALTATANVDTRKTVIRSLEMQSCYVLAKDPNQLNIRFSTLIKPSNPLIIVQPLLQDLKAGHRSSGKCLIFCRTYDDTNVLYELIALELARHDALFVHDSNGKNVCTCEKFDACTSQSVKKRIMDSFTCRDGPIRIVVSTIAFGMGIDVPNICTLLKTGCAGNTPTKVFQLHWCYRYTPGVYS